MLPRDALTLVMLMTGLAATVAAAVTRNPSDPANVGSKDYGLLANNKTRSDDKGNNQDSSKVGEVRCYCNEPKCVSQGYMCLGVRCSTKLPTSVNLPLWRAGYSGCLNITYKKKCPEDSLCCDQDLCNHEDNPAMRNRLNKTLREAMSDQRPYLAPLYPNGQDGGQTTVRWFPSAIVVAICGFVVLLIIASLAVRWLHPIPPQNTNKFVPCRTSDNGPPLLGLPKVPLV